MQGGEALRSVERALRALPSPAKQAAKRAAAPLDRAYVSTWRRRHGGTPVPPLDLRLRIGAGQRIEYYLDSGLEVARALEQGLAVAGRELVPGEPVLDWGCGSGRVLRHLIERNPGVRMHGCDVDPKAIGWAAEHLPQAAFRVNGFEPPLPYPEESFDVVYSISVLTHLDEEGQLRWLDEVRRVLRPGGLALLTTSGEHMLRVMQSPEAAFIATELKRRLQDAGELSAHDGFLFEPFHRTRWNDGAFIGTGEAYGMTFQSEEWTRRAWDGRLQVQHVLERAINHGQDLVIATRE